MPTTVLVLALGMRPPISVNTARAVGRRGKAPGELIMPSGVAWLPSSMPGLVVSDMDNHRGTYACALIVP
jgi:hypothetical protein